MGLALHNFHDTHHRFPAALIHSGRYNNPKSQPYCGPEFCYKNEPYVVYNHTGFVALLPFLEQMPLFQQYDYRQVGSSSSPYGIPIGADTSTNPNRVVSDTLLKVYTCPSDKDPESVTSSDSKSTGFYERTKARRSNYLFNSGVTTDYDAPWGQVGGASRGAFGNDGAAGMQSCIDGTSNTLAIGESKQQHTDSAYGPYWGTGTHTAVHGLGYYINFTPNYPYGLCPGSQLKCQYAWGFGSNHPQTTQFLMCDGAVRSVPDRINYLTFRYLQTPDGGEVVVEN